MKQVGGRFKQSFYSIVVLICFSLVMLVSKPIIECDYFFQLTQKETLKIYPMSSKHHYIVNHYLEEIYDLNSSGPHQYELYTTDELTGFDGSITAASAKSIKGFTAMAFNQEVISNMDDTVVNIYYQRNLYTVTIDTAGTGISEITGGGEYLYGSTVDLIPTLRKGNEWYTWKIDECNDTDFSQNFKLNLGQQSFTMPATDLVLTGYAQPTVFLITVKIIGNGSVTSDSITAYYAEGKDFKITPGQGYKLRSISRDNVVLKLPEIEPDGTYQIRLYSIISNTELVVEFEKDLVEDNSNWVDMMVWGGGGAIAVLLFGASTGILIAAFRRKKTLQKIIKMNSAPEKHLLNALEYAKGRELELIQFCKMNQIDIKKQYKEAVLRFYDENV